MSDFTKPKQVEIYPYNVKKAEKLADALQMSTAEMVNYLIDTATIEQTTTLRLEDPTTKRATTFTRRRTSGLSDYRP